MDPNLENEKEDTRMEVDDESGEFEDEEEEEGEVWIFIFFWKIILISVRYLWKLALGEFLKFAKFGF